MFHLKTFLLFPFILKFAVHGTIPKAGPGDDFDGDYLELDNYLQFPARTPDKAQQAGNYYFDLLKVYKDDANTQCSYQLLHLIYIAPATKSKYDVNTFKTNCKIGSEEYPTDSILRVKDSDTMFIKLKENNCFKGTMVWDPVAKGVRVKESCMFKCTEIHDYACPGSTDMDTLPTPQDEVRALFEEVTAEVWSKDFLQSEMSIRLVSKSWRAPGPSSTTDELLDEYKWDASEAFEILQKSVDYDYVESFMEKDLAQDIFTLKNTNGQVEYDKNLPSIVIVQSLSSLGGPDMVKTTVSALAMRNYHRHNNVFVVDMPGLKMNMIISVMRNALLQDPKYQPMANAIGEFFVKAIQSQMMRPADIHLIGYGYAGSIVGYLGRYIKAQISQPIGSIVALDPLANIMNPTVQPTGRDDAKVVHAYHTNSYPCGTLARVATADFTFNNGFIQEECVKDPVPMLCSHKNVLQKWWYVVLFGSKKFIGRQCDTIVRFNAGLCDSNLTADLSYPIKDSLAKGRYFLRTTDKMPYGKGDAGSVCDPTMKDKMQKAIMKQKETGKSGYDLQLFIMLMTI